MSNHLTTLVTVTYNDRIGYLRELLKRSFEVEGIANAIVVSNASLSPLEELEEAWGQRISIIRLDSNTGSANGYARGIEAALNNNAEYIWLMDDDNAPKPSVLEKLHVELEKLAVEVGKSGAAVLGFRLDHHTDIANGVYLNRLAFLQSSFLGFHYKQIPYKIWHRLPWGKPKLKPLPVTVDLPHALYGGFLAHRKVYEELGLPISDMVLYLDDTEYTSRLTRNHGVIRLVTTALLEDIEESWNLKKQSNNGFEGILKASSDFRAFYTFRNGAYFWKYFLKTSNAEYFVNKILFMILLHYFAWRHDKNHRLKLLKRAIVQGEAAQLGMDADFPL